MSKRIYYQMLEIVEKDMKVYSTINELESVIIEIKL